MRWGRDQELWAIPDFYLPFIPSLQRRGNSRRPSRHLCGGSLFLLLPLTFFSFTAPLYAYSFPDALGVTGDGSAVGYSGFPVPAFSARSLALGGVSIAQSRDLSSLFSNPAGVSVTAERVYAAFTPAMVWSFEKRTHTSFANFRQGTNVYFEPASAALYVAGDPKRNWVAAVGYSKFMDFDYRYEEQSVRDRGLGTSDGRDSLQSSGRLNRFALGLSWRASDLLSLGMAFYPGTGHAKVASRLETFQTGSPAVARITTKRSLGMSQFGLGSQFRLLEEKITLGISLHTPYNISESRVTTTLLPSGASSTSTAKLSFGQPLRLGLGFVFQFDDSRLSNLNFDIIYQPYGAARYRLESVNNVPDTSGNKNPLFRDAYEIHMGFEHWPKPRFALRYGFSLIQGFRLFVGARPAVSFGTGFRVAQAEVDIGVDYSWRGSSQGRIYPLSASTERDAVEESFRRAIATVGYRW